MIVGLEEHMLGTNHRSMSLSEFLEHTLRTTDSYVAMGVKFQVLPSN